MNTHHTPGGDAWSRLASETLRRFSEEGHDVSSALLSAARLPDDETRDVLVNHQLHTALRQIDATYSLWHGLLDAAGVTPSLRDGLLASLAGELGDDECVALYGIAEELTRGRSLLAQPAVHSVLATPPDSRGSLVAAVVRVHLGGEVDGAQLATEVTEHLRTDHPRFWDRLASLAATAAGVAAVDQWRAVTRELVLVNDDLLRHLNRRAEGGYPASADEVAVVSALLDTEVTQGGDGFLTVEADSCPWRDERGRVIHPLGLEQAEG